MRFPRSSGILLHPTSLPSRFGIGDLGPEAFRFVDFLQDAAQHFWQVLPLGPTGFGDSPYMCFSAMAGNHLLLSPEVLRDKGLLAIEDLERFTGHPLEVDYGRVIEERHALLREAGINFKRNAPAKDRCEFDRFCERTSCWLDDYSLFMALKETHDFAPWVTWDRGLVQRNPAALERARSEHADLIFLHKFFQFEFDRQLSALKTYANERRIEIIGDIPIYVAHDSAEVWSHPEYFSLDGETGVPVHVAGVPPDYFSEDGQLWGNPIYDWAHLESDGFAWWIDRIRTLLTHVDVVRIDHFRAFDTYWIVEYGEKTARNGKWVPGPGGAFFDRLLASFGRLPIIAEDLGEIFPSVETLRDQYHLPGMKILQFAFGSGSGNPYLPHNYSNNCVVYTGTHDNDTTIGWVESLVPHEQESVERYLGCSGPDGIHWDLIRLAFRSVADVAIIPLQDVLGLGTDARMNRPSTEGGNWTWRFATDALTDSIRGRLRSLTEIYGRAHQSGHR